MTTVALAILIRCGFLLGNSRGIMDGPSIALLPVVNTAGEKWQELKDKQIAKGNSYLADEFGKRGFKVIDSGTLDRFIKDGNVDFTDEEQQKRDVLFGIGAKANADFVLLAVITGTDQRLIQQFIVNKREGWADVKVWLLDVARHKILLSAKTFRGGSGGGAFAGLDKGSDRQIQAVANGLRDALKEFFKVYPPVKGEKHKDGTPPGPYSQRER